MAEEEETQMEGLENDEPEETPGYKPPAQKTLDEIQDLDADDESLVRYKQALLGASKNQGKWVMRYLLLGDMFFGVVFIYI